MKNLCLKLHKLFVLQCIYCNCNLQTYTNQDKSSFSSIQPRLGKYRSKYYYLKTVINKITREKNVIYNRIRKMRNIFLKLRDRSYSNLQNLHNQREVKLVINPISLGTLPVNEFKSAALHKKNDMRKRCNTIELEQCRICF